MSFELNVSFIFCQMLTEMCEIVDIEFCMKLWFGCMEPRGQILIIE